VTDLEKLIGDKQDRWRGRPRDRLDDFADWRRRVDWPGVAIIASPLLLAALLALVLWPS